MNISLSVFFLDLGALVIIAGFLIFIFDRLERKQKQKRKPFLPF